MSSNSLSCSFLRTFRLLIALVFSQMAVGMVCGQAQYEPGYTVSYSGDTVDCWIKNEGWKNSPKSITIRLTEDGTKQKVDHQQIRAFGLRGKVAFRAEYVKLDVSPTSLRSLSRQREPEWVQDTLFLQELVAGAASLYVYRRKGVSRFFLRVGDSEINQLVFKEYQAENNQIYKNRDFVFQLNTQLTCDGMPPVRDDERMYSEKALTNIFSDYNSCVGTKAVITPTIKQYAFHLQELVGADVHRYKVLDVYRSNNYQATRTMPGFRIGLEGEVAYNVKGQLWAVTLEAGYHFARNRQPIILPDSGQLSRTIFLRYQSIETLLGMRRYFRVSSNTQLFASAFVLTDWNVNSIIRVNGGFFISPYIDGAYTWGGGVGVRHRRLGAELRVYDYRLVLFGATPNLEHRLSKASVVLSYRFF